MKKITDYKGKTKKIDCLACAREKGDISTGNIAKSKYFDAHQDYKIPIAGFIIISSRRHMQSVDEFTTEEQADFINFLCRIRSAMRNTLDVQITYLVQEEDTSHHFHLWVFPRYDWMMEKFGRKIQSLRPIMEYAGEKMKTKDNIKKVDDATKKMKQFLNKN